MSDQLKDINYFMKIPNIYILMNSCERGSREQGSCDRGSVHGWYVVWCLLDEFCWKIFVNTKNV